jgi:ATP-binding cassette subfamily B protein
VETSDAVPQRWRTSLARQLEPGEQPLACFEFDLDRSMHYRPGLAVLTDRRLIVGQGIDPHSNGHLVADGQIWQAWPLETVTALRTPEHSGLGTLEAHAGDQRLEYWRFTARVSSAAHQFVRRFQDVRFPAYKAPERTICPACGELLPAGETRCARCAPQGAPPPTRSLLRLTRFARPHAALIVLGFLLTLVSTAAGMIPPYLTMPLLDNVLIPQQAGMPVDAHLAWWYLGGLAGAALLAWLIGWAKTYVLALVSERVSVDLRNQTYSHLQRLSLEFFGGKRTGDLISRVGSDTDRICNFLSVNLLDFATDVLMIAMTSAILLWIDPVLALVTLIPLPAIAWLVQRVRGRLRLGFERSYRAWGDMVSVLADTIPGIRVVKAFAQEKREVARFRTANAHVLDANTRVNKVWSFFGPMVTLLTEFGLLVVWICGVWRVAHDQITVGVLTAFLAYIGRFYTRLDSMSRMIAATQRAGAAAHRIFEILDRAPSLPEPVRPIHPGQVQGRIELCGVRFRYGPREVIRGMDLVIEPGEMIGLVGPSGAGKSTLINLVCRFFDVAEGAILVDGVDVRSFPVEEYRKNIGIVLQDPFLFYGTVAENIAYGRPSATRAEIIEAARAARAHEFILRLPDGYDSLVGERGHSLSGGERQRISIARALLIDPRILILDEATSSVDTETEREIQEALEHLIKGRTTIAIAHRLSTLCRADRLVVIEQGQIVEVGRHFELLELGGVYARLHQAQLEMATKVAV